MTHFDRTLRIRLALCLLVLTCSCHAQSNDPALRAGRTLRLPGDGGWDYLAVDAQAKRLYVSHGTVVQVVDLGSGKPVGTIPDTKGVHGIALAADLGKGFISNGRDNTITVIDLASLETTAVVPITGKNPDAIMYEPVTHRVFIYCGASANAIVLDARTNALAGTIPLGGKPEFSVHDGRGTVYVNIEDKSAVAVIEAATLKVTHQWPLGRGEEPSGLAIDTARHRLFSVCSNKVMVVMDATTGSVIATLPIGERVDGVVFDSKLRRAYSSNGDGTITVVQQTDPDGYAVLENVTTRRGARTIALDASTHRLYLPTAEYGPPPVPTSQNPRPRPTVVPGSFVVLEYEP